MGTLKHVCDEIGMPLVPDKSVGLVQVKTFLGLSNTRYNTHGHQNPRKQAQGYITDC